MTDDTGTWHYGLVARWWAEVNRPDPAELAYLRDALDRHTGPALDWGCGAGRLLVPLLAEGRDVDGVDISADMIDRARAEAVEAGLEITGRLGVQAFHELDRPRRYALIFSIGSFAIGGLIERDQEALARAHGLLLPGGTLLLSYEVISDADHATLSDQARYPRPWPDTGARATLADGDELELHTRATGYDPGTRTHDLEIRARLWREGSIVREEAGALRNTYYRPETVEAMLRTAGFDTVDVEGPYTGRPPDPSDDTVVVVAQRVS